MRTGSNAVAPSEVEKLAIRNGEIAPQSLLSDIFSDSLANGSTGRGPVIGYVTLGTNDLDRPADFYDALLSQIGMDRLMDSEAFKAWGVSADTTMLSVIKPADGNAATVGNGVMVALAVDTPEKVNALHRKALELGGTDEGAPGLRGYVPGFYAGYFRDLDGNKLNAFCFVSSS